jgi:hypothetical protein
MVEVRGDSTVRKRGGRLAALRRVAIARFKQRTRCGTMTGNDIEQSSFLPETRGRRAINGIPEAARLILQGHSSLPCRCSVHNCIELRHELAGKIDIRKRGLCGGILRRGSRGCTRNRTGIDREENKGLRTAPSRMSRSPQMRRFAMETQ